MNSWLHQNGRVELLTVYWNDETVVWRLVNNKFESDYGLQEFIAYLLETGNAMISVGLEWPDNFSTDSMNERFNEPSPLRGLPRSPNRSEMVSVRRTEISRFIPDVYIMNSIFTVGSNIECQRGA